MLIYFYIQALTNETGYHFEDSTTIANSAPRLFSYRNFVQSQTGYLPPLHTQPVKNIITESLKCAERPSLGITYGVACG